MKPLISIIMSCYNGEKFIHRSVSSVIRQTYQNWELIFWDNNSNDNSAKVIKKFSDIRIKYYKSNETTLLSISRSNAIKQAKGEIISFLDVDDIWLKKKLEILVKKFENNPEACLYFSNYLINSEVTKKITRIRNNFNVNEKTSLIDHIFLNYIKNTGLIAFVTVAIKKRYLNKLEYIFDENLHIAADFELILRLSKNFGFVFDKRQTSIYSRHEQNETLNSTKQQMDELNYCYKKFKKENFVNAKLLDLFKDNIEYNYQKINIQNKNYLIFFRNFFDLKNNFLKIKLLIIFFLNVFKIIKL